MTPARQLQTEKKYCEHWVVCKHAHALLYCPFDATGKHHKECEYDTRATHTSPPAPEQCEEQDACRIPAMCPEVTLAAKAAREQMSTKKWIVVYEMDDYEPAIHEYDNEKEARKDWDDNKTDRDGHKCIALVIEDDESLRAQQEPQQ